MDWQELDQRGPGHAILGVVKDAVHARKQFLAVETARSSGVRVGKRERLQSDRRQQLTAAMDRDLHAVRKRVEGNVNDFAISSEVRNGFAANVSCGPGQLRARLRLKPRLDGLMFHSAAKYTDQVPILIQVKHDAHWLICHSIGPR